MQAVEKLETFDSLRVYGVFIAIVEHDFFFECITLLNINPCACRVYIW